MKPRWRYVRIFLFVVLDNVFEHTPKSVIRPRPLPGLTAGRAARPAPHSAGASVSRRPRRRRLRPSGGTRSGGSRSAATGHRGPTPVTPVKRSSDSCSPCWDSPVSRSRTSTSFQGTRDIQVDARVSSRRSCPFPSAVSDVGSGGPDRERTLDTHAVSGTAPAWTGKPETPPAVGLRLNAPGRPSPRRMTERATGRH